MLSVIPISCATTTAPIELPCPLFPELIVIDEEMEAATPPYVIESVTENYIRLIEYAERLEIRANCK